jgi:parallel beta-helix repeat protein
MVIGLRKAILTSFSILCLSLILFVMECKISVSASPSTIEVPKDYSTIQGAINHANPGDTIFVHSGTYHENVVINKSVSLVGENRDSTIINGSGTGNVISVVVVSNISINGFTITNSGNVPLNSGISIQLSNGNDISNNKIVNNNYGISLTLSGNNVVSDNAIYSNYNYGIYLYSSSNNIIYHNNFFNNTQQASSDSINVWSYDGEGNYWSDYKGLDLNGDGIGDTSYVIGRSTYNEDKYPLMGMFSDFSVTLKRETYHVNFVSNSTISDFRFEVGNETGNKIIRFNATGKESTIGFSRVTIPTELMSYPFIVLVGEEQVIPTLYDVSSGTHAILCFTYIHSNYTITIISSETLHLYNELLGNYTKLQIDLNTLNATYRDLLNNYSVLSSNYSQLKGSYQELNNSYQEHLLGYSESVHNIQNLTYIFAALTAIFIMTTIYLSKTRAHTLSDARF